MTIRRLATTAYISDRLGLGLGAGDVGSGRPLPETHEDDEDYSDVQSIEVPFECDYHTGQNSQGSMDVCVQIYFRCGTNAL